jgi:[protein-PII] uridylyltransferase
MRYIFADHDRAAQIKRIRDGVDQSRAEGAVSPETVQMHPVYDDILCQVAGAFLGYWKHEVALLALGGYGRKEMSPYSDIDLLFLTRDKAPEGLYRGVRGTLHLLWDAKVELGHSVRTVEECRIEAVKDLAVLTSLMDVRFVWGDQEIYRRLIHERDRLIRETDPIELYLRIEGEIDRSSEKFGQTIYLLEPYVKEGPGSLRFMQLITWLIRMVYGAADLDDLPILGVCGSQAVREAKQGVKFLAAVRSRLHYLAGRRDDRLRFEAQSVLADQMGFKDQPERRSVELFMRQYYRCAATNEFFGQTVLARARLFLRPKAGGQAKRLKLDNVFYIGAGGINRFDAPAETMNAAEISAAFLWAARTRTDLDIRLVDLIRNRVRALGEACMEDPAVNAIFLEIFRFRGSLAKAVSAMMNTGFLEAFIPSFERVRFLRQHDAYHQWTVDRHTIAVLENIDALAAADSQPEDRLIRTIFAKLDKPELLYLAALFHDVGKGQGPGHELRGEEIARPVLERIGLAARDIEDVCFLIRNHLAMSHIGFKKDLHDKNMLIRFAETLMTKRMLDMLMLLTHADLKAVGPRGFSSWRSILLEELYYRTLDVIEGESAQGEDIGEWIEQIKAVVRQHIPEEKRGSELDLFLARASSRYLLDFYPGVVADHFLAVRAWLGARGKDSLGPEDIIARKVDHHGPGYSAVTFIARRRRGLFFRIAGALSANRINILSAWSHTIGDQLVIGTFHVNNVVGGPVDDEDQWSKFGRDMDGIIRGELDVDQLVEARRRSWKPPALKSPPKVVIDNDSSDSATIAEVYAQDRPGLLYDITRSLSAMGLYITITKITTEVDQAADIFYLVDDNGVKIVDFDRLDEIRQTLKNHLVEMEAATLEAGTA